MGTKKMKIGYWPFRGLGEFPKMCAAYLGLEFENEHPVDKETWNKEKAGLGFDFPDLPYVKDGDIKITQTAALPMYFAVKARKIAEVCRDIRTGFGKAMWSEDPVEALKAFVKGDKISQQAEQISKYLGERDFFFENVTYVDILIASTAVFMDVHLKSVGADSILLQHANLAEHSNRVLALPGIAERVASDAWKAPWIPPQFLKFELKE